MIKDPLAVTAARRDANILSRGMEFWSQLPKIYIQLGALTIAILSSKYFEETWNSLKVVHLSLHSNQSMFLKGDFQMRYYAAQVAVNLPYVKFRGQKKF